VLRIDVERAHYWQGKKPKALQPAEIVIGIVRDVALKSGE